LQSPSARSPVFCYAKNSLRVSPLLVRSTFLATQFPTSRFTLVAAAMLGRLNGQALQNLHQ
jgi:hypothetical protein